MNTTPINDGGPAFPIPLNPGESWNMETCGNPNGMSLRDWFAGMALQGIIASMASLSFENALKLLQESGGEKEFSDIIAKSATLYADAMLAARERKEEM